MPKDFKGVMAEWGKGRLHSGSKTGPVVKDQKQAVAIAFSEDRKLKGDSSAQHPHRNLGAFLYQPKKLKTHLSALRKRGAFTPPTAPRGATR